MSIDYNTPIFILRYNMIKLYSKKWFICKGQNIYMLYIYIYIINMGYFIFSFYFSFSFFSLFEFVEKVFFCLWNTKKTATKGVLLVSLYRRFRLYDVRRFNLIEINYTLCLMVDLSKHMALIYCFEMSILLC